MNAAAPSSSQGLALVTGGAKRMGRALALALAEDGWDLALHFATSEKEAQETAQMIRALGRSCVLVQADLAKDEDLENLIPTAERLAGHPVAALLNNAALFVRDDAPEATLQMRVNAEAPRRLAEILADRASPEAPRVCLHLLDGTPTPSAFSLYAASKSALETSVRPDARRFAPMLRLNAIHPGPALINPRESKAHFEAMIAATPLGTGTSPAEVAQAALFLLHTPSITGATLPLDGGAHLTSA